VEIATGARLVDDAAMVRDCVWDDVGADSDADVDAVFDTVFDAAMPAAGVAREADSEGTVAGMTTDAGESVPVPVA